MSMIKLAFLNFKSSLKNYLALVLSLAFTILVFLNFQNLIYSNIFDVLGKYNKEYIDILIQVISFVLICFMFFFIWYSTNVFLTRRKKEIGIYIFMGLTNQRIGKLYMIETAMIGITALAAGIGLGLITTWLFQMILLAISRIAVDIDFQITWQPILITAGIYLLFGGLIPFFFQNLVKNKKILYRKERNLWMNSLVFRIQKNYRTYAMVCVLMLCSVTALATSFAMKNRYDNIIRFRSTYTFQVLGSKSNLDARLKEQIEKDSDLEYSTQVPILALDSSLFDTMFQNNSYALLSWSQVKKTAENAGLEFTLEEPADDEIIELRHVYLLSLITDRSHIQVTINQKKYKQIADTSEAYLGYFQENMEFYVVNEREYERLRPLGQELYTYNYRLQEMDHFKETQKELRALVQSSEKDFTGLVSIDPGNSDIEWIKVLYSICIFMFMVFVLASGSILFMKLYNDAFEEKERYQTLKKLGFDRKTLKRAAAHELFTAYAAPFTLMAISSYFSVHALEKMMFTSLRTIHLISLGVILVFFLLCCCLSLSIYEKNAGIR